MLKHLLLTRLSSVPIWAQHHLLNPRFQQEKGSSHAEVFFGKSPCKGGIISIAATG